MANPEVQNPNFVSKISMKSIGVSPAKHATDKGTPIAIILGMASGLKDVVDKVRGETFHALVGEFEANNLETGEVFRSGVLYLPTGIHDMIEGGVKKLQGESDFVQFALQIIAVKANNPAGYTYQAKSLVPSQTVDPLTKLRQSLSTSTAPALPAPAKPESKPAAKK